MVKLNKDWIRKEVQNLEMAIYILASEPFEIKMRLKIAWEKHLGNLVPQSFCDPRLIKEAEEIKQYFIKQLADNKSFYLLHGVTLSEFVKRIWNLLYDAKFLLESKNGS